MLSNDLTLPCFRSVVLGLTILYLRVNASDEEKVIFWDPIMFGQALKIANED